MRILNSSSLSFNRAMAILSGSGSNDIVACNLYISAGKPHHQQILSHVLESSQELCRQLRTSTSTSTAAASSCGYINTDTTDTNISSETSDKDDWPPCRIAIVHAYADGPYDRSSLHLAGRAELVAKVASHVAFTAIDALSIFHLDFIDNVGDTDNVGNSKHPMVGLVDHISIMPLQPNTQENEQFQSNHGKIEHEDDSKLNDNNNANDNNDGIYIPPDANGLAALAIAHNLSEIGVKCVPYGTADRHHTPLAIVRKQKTDFFQSGSNSNANANADANDASAPLPKPLALPLGICTIGSPSNFVENFNIRLTDKISKKQAMTLTKKVRERGDHGNGHGNGHEGVLGVEALTLSYSLNRYEVACNLLRPDLPNGNSDSILEKVEEWVEEQVQIKERNLIGDVAVGVDSNYEYTYFIDEAYRVGTTMDQCLDVMGLVNEDMVREHDELVLERFRNFLT